MPLVHKVCEFYKLFHEHLKLFPKDAKYSLGQKIETLILEILEFTLKVVYLPKEEKLRFLQIIDNKASLLKILIRLSKEIRAIDDNKYISLQERL